jgi:hypothetical protein
MKEELDKMAAAHASEQVRRDGHLRRVFAKPPLSSLSILPTPDKS